MDIKNMRCTPEAYADAVFKDVVIATRDCNGKNTRYEFPTGELAAEFCREQYEEDPENENEEILFVKHDGVCAYSELSNEFPLYWENLKNYFC